MNGSYEISVYDSADEQISLNPGRGDAEVVAVDSIWEAVAALARVPSHGWRHWEDGDTDACRIQRIVLRHIETRTDARGTGSAHVNTLESIER